MTPEITPQFIEAYLLSEPDGRTWEIQHTET